MATTTQGAPASPDAYRASFGQMRCHECRTLAYGWRRARDGRFLCGPCLQAETVNPEKRHDRP